MYQAEIGYGRSFFSLRNGAILGGIVTAIGYLLMVIWTVVYYANTPEPGAIIARGVFGCVLALLVLGLHSWLKGNGRLIAVGAVGLVLLLIKLLAPSRVVSLGGGASMFGYGNGALAVGFGLAVFAMACLVARRDYPDNTIVRYASLGFGISGTLLYLVMVLTALAENRRSGNDLGSVFSSGNVPLITFSILALLGLAGVVVLGLIAGARQVTVKSVCQWGIILGVVVFYLTVGYLFVNFFEDVMKSPERTVTHILILLPNLVCGLGTLFGSILICVVSLGRVIGLLSDWQQWSFVQQLKMEKREAGVAHDPVPPSRATRSRPTPAETGRSASPEYQLQTLKDLHEQGLINQQEYAEKRAEILKRL